ncbi:transposase [Craterilacuibacter sp. RT1T]|nr:transposase [Craterilacuibacter sp. RT1T]MCL6263081.1 transposase [Craterilacuibacter sp. RT1T]
MVDSTGIKMMGEGEWRVKKHGADYRCQWRKLHLGVDAQKLAIRAMEVAENRTGDGTMLLELLSQIPQTEALATVAAGGAYDWGVRHTFMSRSDATVRGRSHHFTASKRQILQRKFTGQSDSE